MITDEQVVQLAQTMATIQVFKDELKRRSMIYQYEAKMRVARYFGMPFEEVNLAFDDWMQLRKKYKAATGCEP